jgi:RNA polymerase sigma-70 factor (ECF subfamily)
MVGSSMTASAESRAPVWVESLFAANERRLGQFLAQMVRDRALAEDLLQDTFVAALQRVDRLAEADDPAAWLFGIARRKALESLRRSGRMRRAVERLWDRRPIEIAAPVLAVEFLDMLERSLSPADRALVILRYAHDFDATQLAKVTGQSPAGVRKRLERARTTLSQEYRP